MLEKSKKKMSWIFIILVLRRVIDIVEKGLEYLGSILQKKTQ